MKTQLETILAKVQNPLTHKSVTDDKLLIAVHDAASGDDPSANKCVIEMRAAGDKKWQLAIEAQVRTQASKAGLAPDGFKFKWSDAKPEVTKQGPVQRPQRSIPGVKHVIAVASGKGGVGKSTVSVNLASTLQQLGKKVGLMDADIYGPSIGKMLGLSGRQQIEVKDDRITPMEKYGLKLMSFSFLVDETQPIVWRGPMLGKAVEQFLYDMNWGELDFLIIDLPPGTGDTQLSLAQLVQTDGAVIVTTPQSVALLDAGRAVAMFEQVNIPILGVVENMSEFICSHCGKPSHIFSKGGGARLAASTDSILLGQVPLVEDCMAAAERGEIPVYKNKNKNIQPVVNAFEHIARNLISKVEAT
ncbi:MAG: Mrp/NBP35 family ATP-binding protein [Leptospiraceae bacterium]|nr:Mrp/NBP35 family ATP-binding protein [Leptospiraceae bacterium]